MDGVGLLLTAQAFLRAGKACHPDKHPDDTRAATVAQQLVNLAYAVLLDADLRAVHERRLVQKRREEVRRGKQHGRRQAHAARR